MPNKSPNTKYDFQPNPKPNILVRLFKFLLRVLLVIAIGYGIVFLSSGNLSKITTYLGNSYKYTKLVGHDLPQPNSLPNPITGAYLTDTWGAARSGGRRHEGIDIFAERGTPIHGTTQGIVRRVGLDDLGGNVVYVVGPGRSGHYYAHLDNFANISEGDWVEAGDVLGYVGDTGNAKGTPPHVHYGIYTSEGAINPYPLLKK